MPESRIVMFVYVAYWIFFGVVVFNLERKIGRLERENSELKEEKKRVEER